MCINVYWRDANSPQSVNTRQVTIAAPSDMLVNTALQKGSARRKMQNLITDVAGLRVGTASDPVLKSGVTVLVPDRPAVAGVNVMGGAPGTRETDLLAPDKTVEKVDALVLSGGSAFGLAAADGVSDVLRKQGIGVPVGPVRVPIVPSAILFDLLNGGDKDWDENPYPALGRAAMKNLGKNFELGTIGAGTGATTATLKGGLGSASESLPSGHTIGALAAVNAVGSATIGDGPHFWAHPFEKDEEFGGLGGPETYPSDPPRTKLDAPKNTTIAIIATDAALTQAQCTRLATAAQDGIARALLPAHTPADGDLVFALSTGAKPIDDAALLMLGHHASTCLSRAISRGIFAATAEVNDSLPTWAERFRP